MTFGTSERNAWGLPTAVEDESFAIMNRYYEASGFFIDTGMMAPWDEQLMIDNRLAGVLPRRIHCVNRCACSLFVMLCVLYVFSQ